MAGVNSTTSSINESLDVLGEVGLIIDFLGDVLIPEDGYLRGAVNTSGLHYIFEDVKARLLKAQGALDELKAETDVKAPDVSTITALINTKLSPVGYALSGLREESKHSQIEANEIDSIEALLWSAKAEILEELAN